MNRIDTRPRRRLAPPRGMETTSRRGDLVSNRTCTVEKCGSPHLARGFCGQHYHQWQRSAEAARPRCSVEVCEKAATRRGWCDTHYSRWQKHGDPETVIVKVRSLCSFVDCGRLVMAHGLCDAHNDQRATGKTLAPIRAWRLRAERDEQGRKLCRRCLEWLPESDFGTSSTSTDGLGYMCMKCNRDTHRLANYGITWDGYQKILADQGGACAICRQECSTGRMLAVDHDHACCPSNSRSCGKCIRGLLCANCNQGIGKLGDSPGRLRAAAEYLERYG